MKEVISIHVGQGGIQVGNAVWELLTAEHNIGPDGKMITGHSPKENFQCMEPFFMESKSETLVPRTIFVDLEPTVIDEIRCGFYRGLHHPSNLINGLECSGNNFARGLFSTGGELANDIHKRIRREFEHCDCVQSFVLYRSLGGGTGTGSTVAICDLLLDYAKVTRTELSIYPAPTLSTSTVEPYNAVLGEHYCMEDIDIGLLFDNEALYDVCNKYVDIHRPNYTSLNRLSAQIISNITAAIRFESILSNDLVTLQTNLVPYPRIHFPLCNYAPILSTDKCHHEPIRLNKMIRSVFEPSNQLVKCDMKNGYYMACSLFMRGKINPCEVYDSLRKIKEKKGLNFVDWDPTGFKVGITYQPPVIIPQSQLAPVTRNCTMLANHTAVGQTWSRLMHKFQMLFSKRGFVHWYVAENLEETEFKEALDNMQTLVRDYKEMDDTARELEGENQAGEGDEDEGEEGEEGEEEEGAEGAEEEEEEEEEAENAEEAEEAEEAEMAEEA